MKIGIVGCGVVGRATAAAWSGHCGRVVAYDKDPGRRSGTLGEALACDLVFVCLPTPRRADGRGLDCSAVGGFFGSIRGSGANLVLRSTVPVGTTRAVAKSCGLPNVCHSPEFLSARTAAHDAHLPSRNIVGDLGDGGDRRLQSRCAAALKSAYAARFPGAPVVHVSAEESELAKLACNSFFAVKIAFFNELRRLSDASGCDWESVRRAVLSDGRIAHSHTLVPGPDGRPGFGGACLPKDLSQFAEECLGAGTSPRVSAAALARNGEDRDDPQEWGEGAPGGGA